MHSRRMAPSQTKYKTQGSPSSNNLQSNYSVPIANSFNTLGNLFVKTSALVGMIVFIVNIPQLSNITHPTTITLMCMLLKLVNLFFQPFPLLMTT